MATVLLATSAARVVPAALPLGLVDLGPGEPLLFIQKKPALVVVDGHQLAPLFDSAQPTGHLLNGDVIDVEQSLDGDHHLSEVLWHNLQQFPHHLGIGDVVAEETQISGELGDVVREILRVHHLLQHQGVELTPKLLCIGIAHPLDPFCGSA
ncbi:hypothetical protein GUJ93_ZPchr0006g42233 [Zizania palustris]|uniref:Secreted protein n=1 Tax=Zizania palustris TaxID=103762 RepID=A0A8J5S625_ZIZPA|nr:hypothetical protein GUJ93_ZPchr0006g42233 [Zizania palustris]